MKINKEAMKITTSKIWYLALNICLLLLSRTKEQICLALVNVLNLQSSVKI